ncbi:MAG: hypothetical protein IJR55_00725 [Clostridia bacterium]|nr:hypothetical protein [Clostridia bacterium]
MEVINTPNRTRCEMRRRDENGVIAYCDHCGFAIYTPADAVVVETTGDTIHKECWEEYSDEHMFDFVAEITVDAEYDEF